MRGLREGGVYLRHYARFLLFWLVHQKWGDCFTYFGIDGTLLNAWDNTTINKPTEDVYRWGL